MTPVTGLVSTIIAIYNRASFLGEAIESVLAQTYRPIEIVVVDDGSTDDSALVARRLVDRYPSLIRYVWQPNQFCGTAWNTGVRESAGEFVQLLDSDDLLEPTKFQRQVEALRAHPECGISYGYIREYVLGQPWSGRPARRSGENHRELFPGVLAGKIFPTPSPLHRREVFEVAGPFLTVRKQEDWEFYARCGAHRIQLHHCRAYVGDKRGLHDLEGRPLGGNTRGTLRDYAIVVERVLEHARRAGVPPGPDLDRFSGRLFSAARHCAAEGFEAEARRLLSHAEGAAAVLRRSTMRAYRAASDTLGWQRVGRGCWTIEQSRAGQAIGRARHAPAAAFRLWQHRARAARALVAGEPLARWPAVLASGWANRRSRLRHE